jgi:hypothetical protein
MRINNWERRGPKIEKMRIKNWAKERTKYLRNEDIELDKEED